MLVHRHIARMLLCALLVFPLALHAQEEDEHARLPLPRFASLKSDETNVRAGPGLRYSISWVYKKAALPVEIVQEFNVWREIRDADGSTGWVHKNMLSGRRMMVITKATRALHEDPDLDSRVLLKAEPGVTGKLLSCKREWCRVQIDSRKGWLKKTTFFGALPGEEFKE
jgi:SH3-like domain-containing protein